MYNAPRQTRKGVQSENLSRVSTSRCYEIDVVVVERGAGEEGAMRMQSGACYRGRAGLV